MRKVNWRDDGETMITYPREWLICDKCGEFFTADMLKEGDVCRDCKKGKVYWNCVGCGQLLKDCKCEKKT